MSHPSFFHNNRYLAFLSWLFHAPSILRRWLSTLFTTSVGSAWDCLPCHLSRKTFRPCARVTHLAMADEAAKDYELPELPRAIFYAMFLNEAERLGVLHGRALRTLESVLTELRWSTFESWVWLYGDRIFETRFRTRVAPEESSGAGLQEEGSEVESEGEGSAHYHVLCPRFSLPKAEGVTTDFELLEMVQATFYAMLLNEAVELGVVHGFMAEGLRSALLCLRWSSFEVWMSRDNRWSRGRSAVLRTDSKLQESRGGVGAVEYVRDNFRWSLREPSNLGPRSLPSDYLGLCPILTSGWRRDKRAIPTP
ncbi:hypothetical protein Cgig2_006761 [Carnegiea gigantea]|uniref:Uncharacterized protein n=1 Tax=Carnegiea gigantea TaxID=171969 RepID=A0A9Q1GNG7_9CARY|nr:hypothetical protein Cgig2_006761 [Carnegiea gigantea]